MKIDARASIVFAFRHEHALHNILISMVLLVLIPLIGPVVLMGYECEIHQRLARRDPHPVPKFSFNDFVAYLGRGVAPFVATLVYSLPVIVLFGALMIGWMLIQLSGVWGGAARGLDDMQAFERLATDSPSWMPALDANLFIGAGLVGAFWLALQIPVIGARILAERSEDFAVALPPRNVWRVLRGSGGRIVVSYLVFSLWSLPLMLGGVLAFCVGVYVVSAALNLAGTHLRWQIAEAHAAAGHWIPEVKAPSLLPSEQ